MLFVRNALAPGPQARFSTGKRVAKVKGGKLKGIRKESRISSNFLPPGFGKIFSCVFINGKRIGGKAAGVQSISKGEK
jgi:hypothetical protein